MDGMFDLGTIQFSIADQIRAAEAAMQERCAKRVEVVGSEAVRAMVDLNVGVYALSYEAAYKEYAAAIRALGAE